MKITKREREGVTILEVEGKVTIGKGDSKKNSSKDKDEKTS